MWRIKRSQAFTIIELLVACALTMLLVTALLSMVSHTSNFWRSASNKIDAFQASRVAFESLTRQLSQVTLNAYWAYDDDANPTQYLRKSELHFKAGPNLLGTLSHAVFFQAPTDRTAEAPAYAGVNGLLGGMGYFIDYVPDQPPTALLDRLRIESRFRLMQWNQNTENLAIYASTSGSNDWYQNARSEAIPIADDIIALVLWPKLPTGEVPPAEWTESYEFDSRAGPMQPQPIKQHQLPPLVQVTMVAIDRAASERYKETLEAKITTAMDGLFTREKDPATTMQADLRILEQRLIEAGIQYRTFSSAVSLREAKWNP